MTLERLHAAVISRQYSAALVKKLKVRIIRLIVGNIACYAVTRKKARQVITDSEKLPRRKTAADRPNLYGKTLQTTTVNIQMSNYPVATSTICKFSKNLFIVQYAYQTTHVIALFRHFIHIKKRSIVTKIQPVTFKMNIFSRNLVFYIREFALYTDFPCFQIQRRQIKLCLNI